MYDCDSSSDEECEPKTFMNRLEDMPAYTMALSQLQFLYTTLKEKNEFLQNVLNTGEQVAGRFVSVAMPVVLVATDIAFKAARPVIGEVNNPVAAIDGFASEMLAKVQEKVPQVKKNPTEFVEKIKSSAKGHAYYYMDKVQDLTVVRVTTKQIDNAIAFTDLMVELCFPTRSTCSEDMKELERIEQDENKGVLVRAMNVQAKAYRRGRRKLIEFTKGQTAVEMVTSMRKTITDMPHTAMKTAESYYSNGIVDDVKNKAVLFVYAPVQVVMNYIHSYIETNPTFLKKISNDIKTNKVQVMETVAKTSIVNS